jgi:hypothetical protein
VAQRVGRALVNEGALLVRFSPQMLRSKLDGELHTLWDGGHVTVRDLWENFAKYVYLPRLRDIEVLTAAAEAAPSLLTWQMEGFATSVGTNGTGRYLGLTTGSHPGPLTPTSLIVNPEFALGQLESEPEPDTKGETEPKPPEVTTSVPTHFLGSVHLDPTRPGRDFGRVVQEVVEHLTALVGIDVELMLEIRAQKDDGIPEDVARAVVENARALKFDRHDLD